jgi:hypothetical protein
MVVMRKVFRYNYLLLASLLLNNLLLIAQVKTDRSFISQRLWFELQSNTYYDNNNFYIKHYQDYSILLLNTKLGIQAINTQKGLVIEPYIRNCTTYDLLKNIWNDVDWHNNTVTGFGCRIRYSLNTIKFINDKICPNDFNIDLIGEKLWINYLKTNEFYIGHRPEDDLKLGIQYWFDLGFREKNERSGLYYKLLKIFWIESAGSFIYSKSDFYVKSNDNFYLLYLNNKIGHRLRTFETLFLEPYYYNSLVYDTGNEIWNRVDWHNNVKNGIGFRTNYRPGLNAEKKNFSIILGFFVEYLRIGYFNSTEYIPSYRPKQDWFAGVNFWLSISGYN